MKLVWSLVFSFAFSLFFWGTGFAADLGPIDVHGFISQGYLQSTANDYLVKSEKGSFEFNEVGVNFSTNLTDKLRLGMQLMARDLGDAGNNEVLVDWAFADYRWRNELGLRVGKIKIPLGFYNESRDTDALRTWILLPQGVYMEVWRDFVVAAEGVGIYGTINAGPVGSFEYQDVLGTIGRFDTDQKNLGAQLDILLKPYAFTGQTLTPEDFESTGRKLNTMQLIWNTPLDGLRLGATWTFGKMDFEAPAMNQVIDINPNPLVQNLVLYPFPARSLELDMAKLLTFSGEYKWKNLTIASEFIEEKIKADYGIDPPATMTALGIAMPSGQTLMGYYGSLAYRFTDWLELGAYYSVYYPNKDDKKGEDLVANATKAAALTGTVAAVDHQAWQKDTCVTARFDINSAWCFKVEGHHINGTAQVYDYANVNELSKVWSLYAAKASFSF